MAITIDQQERGIGAVERVLHESRIPDVSHLRYRAEIRKLAKLLRISAERTHVVTGREKASRHSPANSSGGTGDYVCAFLCHDDLRLVHGSAFPQQSDLFEYSGARLGLDF